MPTYLVLPPPYHQRMQFMDDLDAASLDYSREPDGYYIYLRHGQQEAWERILHQFQAVVEEEDPAMLSGP